MSGEAATDPTILKWILGVLTVIFSFFLYGTRDKVKEYKEKQNTQDALIHDLNTKVTLMENLMVTDKELTRYLTDLKKEFKSDISDVTKAVNDLRSESSASLDHMRQIVTRLVVLMEKERPNGDSE